MKYNILSPDGIPIENYDGYNSIEETYCMLMEWKKRFE
jgi:hypothetical protein